MLRTLAFATLTTVFSTLAAAPAAAFGIGLQPTTVEMEIAPGERKRQVINIANVHTEKTISLTIGLADWTLDENGQIALSPPGEDPASSADWARFSPAFVTLEPGEAEQIVVDLAAPARVQRSGDHRFALLASTILPEERGQGSGVWKRYQIASLFYLTTGEAESLPEITSSGIAVDENGQAVLGMRIENAGNAHARLKGSVEIDSGRGEVRTQPIDNLVVLDQGARNFRMTLPGDLGEAPKLTVRLENIFAPQVQSGILDLAPHTVTVPARRASLEPAESVGAQ